MRSSYRPAGLWSALPTSPWTPGAPPPRPASRRPHGHHGHHGHRRPPGCAAGSARHTSQPPAPRERQRPRSPGAQALTARPAALGPGQPRRSSGARGAAATRSYMPRRSPAMNATQLAARLAQLQDRFAMMLQNCENTWTTWYWFSSQTQTGSRLQKFSCTWAWTLPEPR